MIDMPMADFRGRVLVSRERVKFADADPYAHLASGAYVDMIMKGERSPGMRTAHAIERVFGIPMRAWMEPEQPVQTPPTPPTPSSP